MQFPIYSYNTIKLVQCHSQSINLSLDSTVPIPVLYTTVYLIVDCVIYVYVINFLNLFSLPPQSRAWTKMMCTVLECLLVKWWMPDFLKLLYFLVCYRVWKVYGGSSTHSSPPVSLTPLRTDPPWTLCYTTSNNWTLSLSIGAWLLICVKKFC